MVQKCIPTVTSCFKLLGETQHFIAIREKVYYRMCGLILILMYSWRSCFSLILLSAITSLRKHHITIIVLSDHAIGLLGKYFQIQLHVGHAHNAVWFKGSHTM